jgi:hypothetical protein
MIVPSVRLGFEEGAWDTGDHGSGTVPSSRFWVSRWWEQGRSRRRRPPAPLQGPSAASSGSTRSATRSGRPSGRTSWPRPPPTRPGSPVHFFQVQRDGAHVPRRLDRKPSHLTDRHATVYATPVFEGDEGTCRRRRSSRSAGRWTSKAAGSTPRLRQVHPRDRLLGGRAAPRPAWPAPQEPCPGRRDPPRPAVAGQGLGRAPPGPVRPGRAGHRERAVRVRRRPRRVATARGRRRVTGATRRRRVLHQVPAGVSRRTAGRADQPQPGRARCRRLRPRRPGGGRERPQAGPGTTARRGLGVRHGQDHRRRRARDGLPARLLPRGLLAGRHGVRGRGAGAGRQEAARPAGGGLAAGRHPLGQAVPTTPSGPTSGTGPSGPTPGARPS